MPYPPYTRPPAGDWRPSGLPGPGLNDAGPGGPAGAGRAPDTSRPAVLVTGGARRIGAAIARHLASRGWPIVVHYRQSRTEAEALCRALRTEYQVAAACVGADLADPAAVAGLLDLAELALGGPVGHVVNNASEFEYDNLASFSVERLEQAMRINLAAPLLLAQALHQRATAGGSVVHLLDQKLANPNPDYLSYTLTKQALAGSVTLLARAMAPLRVNGVSPGISLPSPLQTQEEFERSHRCTPLGRSSDPADLAAAVAFLIECPAVTGQVLTVDGGQHLLPTERDIVFLTAPEAAVEALQARAAAG